jgi:branched-chain amino acid transport system ATP-binding protein
MTLIEARDLHVGYGGNAVARAIDITVNAGELVVLLGANGAGKTTTMNTLAGILSPVSGSVVIDGKPTKATLHRRARNGLAIITEQRSVFMTITVEANLQVAKGNVDLALRLFPELVPLLKRRAGLLSGGEQQMLALARVLSRRPRLVLADEISLGLAPLVVARLHAALRAAADEGTGVLLVEQHSALALRVADRAYVLSQGSLRFGGSAQELAVNPEILRQAYFAAS